jgi:CheY-like chemotaxis protein
LNFSAHIVENAYAALEAVETYTFDAILMDIRLPEMDGIECAKKIRELEEKTQQRVPIIAVTACTLQGDKENILGSGFDDYLAKPFTLEQLRDVVLRWTAR